MQLNPAILIVSETAFNDPSTDRAGDILRNTLRSDGGDKWTQPLVEIVPDDAELIETAVRRWTDDEKSRVNLVITTGGTGFAANDMTPEVG
jgi:gephyrin